MEDRLWFSTAKASRKGRNLERDPRCTATTDDAQEPVVLEGTAERIGDHDAIDRFATSSSAKYETELPVEFYEDDSNSVWAVSPTRAFGLIEADFYGSPTRWRF